MDSLPPANRYWVKVDELVQNNAHSFAIDMVGYNKRVLELGPAAGHVTRALVRRGCRVVGIEFDAEAAANLEGVAECLVGDLNDPSIVMKAGEEHSFDVVLAGDVLEHLVDPLAVLRACRDVIAADGYVVVSLPNVAHADVALSLVTGRFHYNENGLLDRTHLRFFTHDSIMEMFETAGFVPTEIRRVVRPVFETELGVGQAAIPGEVVEAVLAHDEAETYQFVVRAVPHNGDLEMKRLAERALAASDDARRERSGRLVAEAELSALRKSSDAELTAVRKKAETELITLRRSNDTLRVEADRWRTVAASRQQRIERIERSRTMRYTAPLRGAYRSMRRLGRR